MRGVQESYSQRENIKHQCPPGKRWVNGYYRRRKFGFGMEYVEGHCQKNGTSEGMKVKEVETKKGLSIPPFKFEKRVKEVPVEDDHEAEDV